MPPFPCAAAARAAALALTIALASLPATQPAQAQQFLDDVLARPRCDFLVEVAPAQSARAGDDAARLVGVIGPGMSHHRVDEVLADDEHVLKARGPGRPH